MNADQIRDKAHRRLLNAVISFAGAGRNGSAAEMQLADIEMQAAAEHSQAVLYPKQSKDHRP